MKARAGIWAGGALICGLVGLLAVIVALPSCSHGRGQAEGGFIVEEANAARLITAEELDQTSGAPDSRLTEAMNDARNSALLCDLQTVRNQIELYKVQHMNRLPGADTKGNFDQALFVKQMTCRTNARGEVMPIDGDSTIYPYGPYLMQLPDNPFAGRNPQGVASGKEPVPGDGSTGWYLNTRISRFSPNDPAHKDQ